MDVVLKRQRIGLENRAVFAPTPSVGEESVPETDLVLEEVEGGKVGLALPRAAPARLLARPCTGGQARCGAHAASAAHAAADSRHRTHGWL